MARNTVIVAIATAPVAERRLSSPCIIIIISEVKVRRHTAAKTEM